MSLETRIDDDWKAAMKAGDKARKDALSLLRAAIKQKRVDDKVEMTDAVVVAVIEKMLKQRKDSITQYEAAQRRIWPMPRNSRPGCSPATCRRGFPPRRSRPSSSPPSPNRAPKARPTWAR
jgi:hypothetical protein